MNFKINLQKDMYRTGNDPLQNKMDFLNIHIEAPTVNKNGVHSSKISFQDHSKLDGDTEGLDEHPEDDYTLEDVELVMRQTDTSRTTSLKALKKAKGDIVDAILELTMR